jgi:hypothetical protein
MADGPPPRVSDRWLRPVVLVFLGVMLVGCCGCPLGLVLDYRAGQARAEDLERDLGQNLPVGSTREQARAWFASRGIDYIEDGANTGAGEKTTYSADLPDRRVSDLIWDGKIWIEVRFDERDRVHATRVFRYEQ